MPPPSITLYTAQTSNGIKVSITLEEPGLLYKLRNIDMAAGGQKSEATLSKMERKFESSKEAVSCNIPLIDMTRITRCEWAETNYWMFFRTLALGLCRVRRISGFRHAWGDRSCVLTRSLRHLNTSKTLSMGTRPRPGVFTAYSTSTSTTPDLTTW